MQEELFKPNYINVSIFFDNAIKNICGLISPSQTRILDFGCGKGELLYNLTQLGYDTYGCDFGNQLMSEANNQTRKLRVISQCPYRLPFDNSTFDVVISTSTMEHVTNKNESFREIHRVLRAGGWSMHSFPGKWYLPHEPHIRVPLINWFYPQIPELWLWLWALLGVRNEYQSGESPKDVFDNNLFYCKHQLSYWTTKQYRELSLEIFGNFSQPMEFYIRYSYGGMAKLLRHLPLKNFTGKFAFAFRQNFIVAQKAVP